jgi:uncharacterized protein
MAGEPSDGPESRPEPSIRDHPPGNRYEIVVDGTVAGIAAYERRPGRIVFVHTEVIPAFKGRGLADRLARWALDDVRARGGEKVIPRCPFIAGFIGRHPEYNDLLAGRPPAAPAPPVTRD